jgi:hypothetical protein
VAKNDDVRASNDKNDFGEIVDLVKTYAKQETVGPLRSAGRYLAYGLSGASACCGSCRPRPTCSTTAGRSSRTSSSWSSARRSLRCSSAGSRRTPSMPEPTAERVTPEQIEARLRGLKDQLEERTSSAKQTAMPFAIGGGLLLLFIVYLLGKRVGKRKSTVVEIRRI